MDVGQCDWIASGCPFSEIRFPCMLETPEENYGERLKSAEAVERRAEDLRFSKAKQKVPDNNHERYIHRQFKDEAGSH